VVTRKQARKGEILRVLPKGCPACPGLSSMELAKRLGLGYRAVQAATSELSAEGKIHGRITGNER
jgi:hypothetical protein